MTTKQSSMQRQMVMQTWCLLDYRTEHPESNIDPGAQNNKAIINAASNGHADVVQLGLELGLGLGLGYGHADVVAFFSTTEPTTLNPTSTMSAQNNKAIINAASDGCEGSVFFSTTKPNTPTPRSTQVLRTTKPYTLQREMVMQTWCVFCSRLCPVTFGSTRQMKRTK